MITIRNPKQCQSLTVVAGAALKVGQLVKLVQGTASGEPPQVTTPAAADYKDADVFLGVVYYVPDDDEAVDFVIDTNDSSLTVNTDADNTTDIASGEECTFWFDKPIIGFTEDSLSADASATIAITDREGAAVCFNTNDALLDLAGATLDVNDVTQGMIYRNEGAELTVLLANL